MTTDVATIDRPCQSPGVYRGLSREQYDAIKALNLSELLRVIYDVKIPDNCARLGEAFHMAMQPWRITEAKREPIIKGPDVDLRKPDDKERWAQAVADHPDQIVLRPKEWDQCKGMIQAVRDHPQLAKVMQAATPDNTEVALVWLDDCGLYCKALLDFLGDSAINDWKTTSCANEAQFNDSIWKFRLHLQAEFYCRGAAKLDMQRGFNFLCVSKLAHLGHPAWVSRANECQEYCAKSDLTGLLAYASKLTEFSEFTIPF